MPRSWVAAALPACRTRRSAWYRPTAMATLLKPGVLLREKWRIDRFLGRGATSAVYAATHRNGMRGAIKVLHRELTENELMKKRFMREGYVANKLEHVGAVRVLDDDITDDGLVFLVMELLEGMTVKQRWIEADRKLELPFVLDVVDQVLAVLEAAHVHKIVHRDLKPDNLFIVEGGAIKVLDFGIARLAEAAQEGQAETTNSSAMMGTPAFMPPEQALSHWHRVDSRTDLFALAATAYTLLSGQNIHPGTTVPELLIAASTIQVAPVRSRLVELDEETAAVLDRALRFEPNDRWPDARAMRLALLQAKSRASAPIKTVQMSAQASPSVAPQVHALSPAAGPAVDSLQATAVRQPSTERMPPPATLPHAAELPSTLPNGDAALSPAPESPPEAQKAGRHDGSPVHYPVGPKPARAVSLWIYALATLLLVGLAATVWFLRR